MDAPPRVKRPCGTRVDFVLRGKVVELFEVLREDDTFLVTAFLTPKKLASKRTEPEYKFPEQLKFPQSQKHLDW